MRNSGAKLVSARRVLRERCKRPCLIWPPCLHVWFLAPRLKSCPTPWQPPEFVATKSSTFCFPFLQPWGSRDSRLPCSHSLPSAWELPALEGLLGAQLWQAGRSPVLAGRRVLWLRGCPAHLLCCTGSPARWAGSLHGHLPGQSGNQGSPGEHFGFESKCTQADEEMESRRMNLQCVAGSFLFCLRTRSECRQSSLILLWGLRTNAKQHVDCATAA